MPVLKLTYKKVPGRKKYGAGAKLNSLSLSSFRKFNSTLLGLGDVSEEGEYKDALAAIFDLEGFTYFSSQPDSHLVVPEFLSEFLEWLFLRISYWSEEYQEGNRVMIWGSLPFYAKFLGDGVLLLWDTDKTGGPAQNGNLVFILHQICKEYVSHFLPRVRGRVASPPNRLRCGIARGRIISIGNGQDFIGPCINIASRLQKVSGLSFAFSRRGFNPLECFSPEYRDTFVLKQINIRGVGNQELIFVDKQEFEALKAVDRKKFRTPSITNSIETDLASLGQTGLSKK